MKTNMLQKMLKSIQPVLLMIIRVINAITLTMYKIARMILSIPVAIYNGIFYIVYKGIGSLILTVYFWFKDEPGLMFRMIFAGCIYYRFMPNPVYAFLYRFPRTGKVVDPRTIPFKAQAIDMLICGYYTILIIFWAIGMLFSTFFTFREAYTAKFWRGVWYGFWPGLREFLSDGSEFDRPGNGPGNGPERGRGRGRGRGSGRGSGRGLGPRGDGPNSPRSGGPLTGPAK